jgi:hypothetical protein
MADKNSLQNRRSLFTQSNQGNYYNQVFNDFNKYSQTLVNRFAPPNKPGKSIDESSSESPVPSPTPSPSPSPTPAPIPTDPLDIIQPQTTIVRMMLYGGDEFDFNDTTHWYSGSMGTKDTIYDETTSTCYVYGRQDSRRVRDTTQNQLSSPFNECNYPFPSPPSPGPVPNGTYSVGDSALGGVIAYILQPGDPGYSANEQHGLIAAAIGDGSIWEYTRQRNGYRTGFFFQLPWGCVDTLITGANSAAIGSGAQNTIDILVQCNPPEDPNQLLPAPVVCDGYYNSYTDWYLPSKDELNKLYQNRVAIGGFATSAPSGRVLNYWSSTQVNTTKAWAQNFETGTQIQLEKGFILTEGGSINGEAYYRPVRSF